MNIEQMKDGPLKAIFDALEDAFAKNNIDFYLIGAQARDQWYAKEKIIARRTNDVDIATFISNVDDYSTVRYYLIQHYEFTESPNNQFVLFTKEGTAIDILPFGEIEIDDAIQMQGEGLTNIKVNGFREIHKNGTAIFRVHTGHEFKIASLPSIVLLKLVAYDDRPEKRKKDAIDINSILMHYFNLQSDFIYENHHDLFTNEALMATENALPELAAIVIGREINKIISENNMLLKRIKSILTKFFEEKENSVFIRSMLTQEDDTIEEKTRLIQRLLEGLEYE